ncbi:hypothetical protein ACFQ08_00285 [Streptosporangium algeriense]|uniref:Uncharacterized protein n=1 Tax=Streptosporangium algeriense TaxID=1682748 RepID=A0ABW3DJ36_9ACTN
MPVLDGIVLPARWMISSRLLAAWPINDDHLLEVWPAGHQDGRIRWYYRLSRKSRTIFAASDICSAAGTVLSTQELARAARSVLAFLTLRPGDVEAEYFDVYTATQLAWRDRYAEDLAVFALEDVCGYCGSATHSSPACPL